MKEVNDNNELNNQNAAPEEGAVTGEASPEISVAADNASADGAKEKNKKKSAKQKQDGATEEKLYKLPLIKKPVKKITLIRIICIAAAVVVAVVALTLGLVLGLKGSSGYTVTFEECEHVEYNSALLGENAVSGGKAQVKKGEMVTFTVLVEDGYSQSPYVAANDSALTPVNGEYSFVVTEDVTVKVSEIFEVAVSLSGQGTESSPWILTSAREINYVAERVNGGSASFIQGYYALSGDIDCKGAALNVIGNGRTATAFFGGYVDGNGYTISNFVINASNMGYAGLFGYVQSSGTGVDELGTIKNLNLKDYTLNVSVPDTGNVFAGSFIGYSMAAQLVNCGAENGVINVLGSAYFSYVGGAVGAQQSATATTTDGGLYPFYSTVNKVHTNVDIVVGSGYVFGAGGITGFVYSDHELAPSVITNSYSEGDVYGAVRAGGIAGLLENYSSVTNCYSTGEIESYTKIETEDYGTTYDAFAGGIVGYAGINTVVSGSFTTAKLYAGASGGQKFAHTGDIAGGYDEGGLATRPLVIHNSSKLSANPSASYLKDTLGWREIDWVISEGSLPQINPAEPAEDANAFNVVLNYGGKKVGGLESQTATITNNDGYYSPLSAYFPADNGYQTDEEDGSLTSYGYFFDSQFKQQVPYGYTPAGNVTLYIAFADYSEVAGTYYHILSHDINNIGNNVRTVALTLTTSGEFTYEDVGTFSSYFTYDGETLIIYDALFARLSNVIIDNSPNLNYEQYNFAGKINVEGEGKTVVLYDGTYFTESDPIRFSADAPSQRENAFVGVWEISATINQTITFSSNGSWSSTLSIGGAKSGSYTVGEDGVASLGNNVTAQINRYGLLDVTADNGTQTYCYQNSLFGTWFDVSSGSYVMFDGYGSDLYGYVIVNLYGSTQQLIYVRDGFFDSVDRIGAPLGDSVTLLYADTLSLFGYLLLDESANTLGGVLYSTANGGFVEVSNLYLVDDYAGEWIAHDGDDYIIVNFNGFGSYEVNSNGVPERLGYMEMDGQRYTYTVDLADNLKGKLYIGSEVYDLSFDIVNRTVTIISGSADSESFTRKDVMYEYPLIDGNNNTYVFNGGGSLTSGGVLTVTLANGGTETYNYKIEESTVDENNYLRDITISLDNGAGSITVSDYKFIFEIDNERRTLELNLAFSGTTPWVINGYLRNFTIGNFDLSYTATGRFADMTEQATYTYNREGGYVTVEYIAGEMTSYATEYLILLDNDNIVVSSYPYLVAGDYLYASRQDEYYMANGWAETTNSAHVFVFDGLADSKYANGIVYEYLNNAEVNYYYYTRRFGKIYMWQYDDESNMYVFETVAYTVTGENVFNNGARSSFRLVEFDAEQSSIMSVNDGTSQYEFYLDGSFTKDGKRGTYELIEVNGAVTRLVIHVVGENDRTANVNSTENTIEFID